MGLLDRILRRKPAEPESAKYILKRQNKETGGMAKVSEFAEIVEIEDLYKDLVPGIYALHKYSKGKSGFDVVWGPIEVTGNGGDEGETTSRKGKGSALEQMVGVLKGMAELQKNAKEEFDVIAPFFGYGGAGGKEPKTLLEELKDAKDQYELLGGFFGDRTSGDAPISYKGEVPIWLHPKLIPGLADNIMDNIEKRLGRWGALPSAKTNERKKIEDELPAFPQRPPRKEVPSEKVEPVEDVEIDVEEEPDTEDESDDQSGVV